MTETRITPAEVEVTRAKWLRFVWPMECANEPITAVHRDILKKIEADVVTIDPTLDPDSEGFGIAVLVIAGGMLIGPFADRLAELTGFPLAMVFNVFHNMHSVGLWKEFATDAEWLDKEGYRPTAVWRHVFVAAGKCTAKWDDGQGAWTYQAVPVV